MIMKIAVFLLFLTTGSSMCVTRLYEQFHPEHYDIVVSLDKHNMSFEGTVRILGEKVGAPASKLVLHQKDVTVTHATITDAMNNIIETTSIEKQPHHEQVVMHTAHNIVPGKYCIQLEFSGTINTTMLGVYASSFEYNKNQEKIITTQFESHFARTFIPCIDEPEAKATFNLTLIADPEHTVVSNTPIKQSNVNEHGKLVTSFETTPCMSTYLLAFTYGLMNHQEGKTKDGITIRVYATPEKVQYADFALETSIKSLEFFSDYFGIPYPLKKCDMVALPDFDSGAMENWGCITYREGVLLVDPINTSLSLKQQVAITIAHELAHQWFGNLVTMRWWTDLWLNEGFATWVSYLAIDQLFPEWHIWDQFVVMDQRVALKLDALKNTHPIEVPISHPDEIRTIFDEISYYKGASVIRMLHGYLGKEAFREGLHHYLAVHAYSNTITQDLWIALEKTSKKPVVQYMSAWTRQEGYPLVSCMITDRAVQISQKRFLFNPVDKMYDTLWPIALEAWGEVDIPPFMDTRSLTISQPHQPGLLVLNHNLMGFYRVIYNNAHTHALAEAITQKRLSTLDRLGIMHDAFEAAKVGYLPTTDVLKLITAYEQEEDPAVWDVIASVIKTIKNSMNSDRLWELMKPLVHQLTYVQRMRLGWEPSQGESPLNTLVRIKVLELAALADEPSVIDEIQERFARAQSSEDLAPDMRRFIYLTVARLGDEKTFDKLVQFLDTTQSSEEHLAIAGGLTGFKQEALIKKALDIIKSPRVRLQNVISWTVYSLNNASARKITWEWIQNNWTWLRANLNGSTRFTHIPLYIAQVFSDESFLSAYKAFFKDVMEPALERNYHQGIETIEWQSAWEKRDIDALMAYCQAMNTGITVEDISSTMTAINLSAQ